MKLKYGDYVHAVDEAGLGVVRTTNFSPSHIAQSITERWAVRGLLLAADQTSLMAAIDAMKAAYGVHNQDAVLYLDDGSTPTTHALLASQTVGGVRVVQQPSFESWEGGELGLFATYSLALEGDIPYTGPTQQLLVWEETLSYSGGGPKFVYLPTMAGPPIRQQVQQFTPYRMQQTGRAVGYFGYPISAFPIYPTAEHIDQRQPHVTLPRRVGDGTGLADIEYEIGWSYSFESDVPLVALPTPRPF